MAITRTPLVDDDGSGYTGTVINNAWQTELYDAIDEAIEGGSGGVTLPISLTTDVTGTLQAAQEPAHTGDVTNAAGSLALAIGAGKVTSAMIASGGIAPAKITLTTVALIDGASVALDVITRAAVYILVALGDRTITTPQNPIDGQKIIIRHTASGGARTLTLAGGAGGFRFGSDITALSATASGKTDYIGCIYNGTDSRWDIVAVAKGF